VFRTSPDHFSLRFNDLEWTVRVSEVSLHILIEKLQAGNSTQ
jgi:hypothetical protein